MIFTDPLTINNKVLGILYWDVFATCGPQVQKCWYKSNIKLGKILANISVMELVRHLLQSDRSIFMIYFRDYSKTMHLQGKVSALLSWDTLSPILVCTVTLKLRINFSWVVLTEIRELSWQKKCSILINHFFLLKKNKKKTS